MKIITRAIKTPVKKKTKDNLRNNAFGILIFFNLRQNKQNNGSSEGE
jgi:hypothetical protein